ncbi:MAG: hypothetical protein ABI769_10660 [Pseudomonadota bacterium]
MGRSSIPASILLMLISAITPAFAGEKHLLLGTWNVDVSKLEQADPPASVTMVFAEAGGDRYSLSFDIVTRDGQLIHVGSSSTFKPDGSLVSVPDSYELDLVTFAMPNRRTLVMGGALAGHPSHTRIWSLSDDGKSMTETIVGHIDGKTPHIRTAIWTRRRG